MTAMGLQVLIVSESNVGASFFVNRLKSHGCECRVVASTAQAIPLCTRQAFDLVLCGGRTEESRAQMASFLGLKAWEFRWYDMHDHSHWLLAIRQDGGWPAAPELQPRDFAKVLDHAIEEAKSAK